MTTLRLSATFASRLATVLRRERAAGHLDLRLEPQPDGTETLVCEATRLSGSLRAYRIRERRR